MALIKCPSCGADISDQALQCPKCGHNFNSAQETTTPVAQPQSCEPRKANLTKRLKQCVAIGLIIIICIQLFPRLIGGQLSVAEIVQYGLLFFFAWLYRHLTKTRSSQAQNPTAAPAAPTAALSAVDMANWQIETPRKAFSGSIRISTVIVSLLAISTAVVMLLNIPGKPESAFDREYMTDIFNPIRTGLYVLIAANAITLIIAIADRYNNSHAVAAGMIGTLLAGGITILMNYSQNQSVSELEGYYHTFSGDTDTYLKLMIAGICLASFAVVGYMIIAASIAAARRRYVTGLMAYPTADRAAMQQYCSNRGAMIFLWVLLSIAIIAALIFFYAVLKSK